MWIIETIISIIGIICFFNGMPTVTIIAAAVIIIDGIVQLFSGALHSLGTYIIAIIIGGLIGKSVFGSFIAGASLALCIEDIIFQVIGLLMLGHTKKVYESIYQNSIPEYHKEYSQAPMVVESESNNRKNRFCRKCGAKLPEGGKFCNKCGTPIV